MSDLDALAACILSDQVPQEDVPRLCQQHPGLEALLRPSQPQEAAFMLDLSERLSPNFTLGEMLASQTAARRGIDNTPQGIHIARLRALCHLVLQPVRDHFGPVVVSSGFRSPALNEAVGGSASSQHMRGEAADIEVPGISNVALARWIEKNCGFDQIILEFHKPGEPYSGWVHVSFKTEGNRKQTLTVTRAGTLTGLHG